jgi:hypothetical protein
MSENKLSKKYIGDDQVGASQIELENNSSLKAKAADGLSSQDLMKLSASNELMLLKSPYLPSDASDALQAIPKQQLDAVEDALQLQIDDLDGVTLDLRSDLDQEILDREAADLALQGEIDAAQADATQALSDAAAAQADVDILEPKVSTLETEMDTVQSDISTLQSEMNDVESDISSLQGDVSTAQSDISTLQGEMDVVQEQNSVYEGIVYNSYAPVYADAQPGILDPKSSTNPRPGWYFQNDVAGEKCNWYFFDGQNQATIQLQNFSAYAIMQFDSVSPLKAPILTAYTFPTGSGDFFPGFAHSKVVYSAPMSITPVVGKQYVVYFGENPAAHPELPRIELTYVASQSGGDQGPTEIVLTSTFGSDSSAGVNTVQFMVEKLGVNSPSYRAEVDLEIRPAFRELDGSVNMLAAKISNLANPTLAQDAATKAYVDSQVSAGTDFEIQKIVLSASDISNQYIDLSFKASIGSVIISSNRVNLIAVSGVDSDADFRHDNSGSVTRLIFQGPSASGGDAPLSASQILFVNYVKA